MAKHNAFSIFRRNQRAWMAGLTLFTMFSFIVLGNMFQCIRQRNPGGAGGHTVYATTEKFGDLDYTRFVSFRQDLTRLQTFLQAATQKLMMEEQIIQYGGMMLVMDNDPNDPAKQSPVVLDNLVSLFQETSVSLSESRRVADRWLISQTAAAQGFKADETSVRDYLNILFHNRLTQDDFDYALKQSGMTFGSAVEVIGDQIACERLYRAVTGGHRWSSEAEQVFPSGLANIVSTPADAFEAYQRLYRKYRTGVVAFPADKYRDQVTTPSEETLRKLYNQYQFITYTPFSKTPGFSVPTKMAFEVVRGKLTPERIAAVSADEVKAYYENKKDTEFLKPTPPPAPQGQLSPAPLGLSGGSGPSLMTIPEDILSSLDAMPVTSDSKDSATNKENTETMIEEKKAEEPKVEEKKESASEPKSEETVPSVPPSTETSEPKPDAEPTTFNSDNMSPFRQVSYLTEQTADSPPVDSSVKPADDKQPEEKAATEDTDKAAAEKVADEEKAAAEKTADEEKVAAELAAMSPYFPLEMVEETIRRQLASEKLNAEMNEIFEQMTTYSKALANIRAGVTAKTELKKIDLAELAAQKGFDFIETTELLGDKASPKLLTLEEAHIQELLPDSILVEKFESIPIEYSPENSGVVLDTAHLYWVTKVKAAYQPDFDEAKPLVLQAWKKQEAAKIALKEATAFAEKVREAKTSLIEAVKLETIPLEYVETQKFSWFDFPRGFRDANLAYGEIREEGVPYGEADRKNKVIIAPGDNFFKVATGLEVNGVGVALNQPEDRVHVIQMLEKDSDELILSQFDTAESDPFARQAVATSARQMNYQFHEDWVKELQKNAGFKWVVIPRDLR